MTPQERRTWVRAMGARADWWKRRQEAIVAPDLEVVDAHLHLWDERDFPDPQDAANPLRTSRYLVDEYLRDAGRGHTVTECVYIDCGSSYYTDGPASLRPVGETEYAAGLAEAMAASGGPTRIGAIVGFADLRDRDLDTVLDAHEARGGGLFRGIRQSGARLEDPSARLLAGAAPPGLYAEPAFRRGVARLGERGMTFDAFQFHFQAEQFVALAKSAPGTTMIVNHLGTPIGYTPGPASRDPVFVEWARGVEQMADLPNVVMKLGGIASIVTGYDAHRRDRPPSAQDFVDERGAYFHHAIRCFGAERCMFETNFPVDSVAIGYDGVWNAYKLMAMDYDAGARDALLAGTTRRVYRMHVE
ncbi:amidohydrolase family protein [Microbaculum marinum]|uniref:Amidohydrolase family protein n=1 Tax=Microbaculum marinum TaxID=1764581 RepID=A0AAW9RX27_9HYPH